jgi:hypothetical protein
LALADGSSIAVCESHDGAHVSLTIVSRDGTETIAKAGVDLEIEDAHLVGMLIQTAVRRLRKDKPDPEPDDVVVATRVDV